MIDFSPNVRPIAAVRARVLIRQGRTGEALDWAREHGLSVEDDLSYCTSTSTSPWRGCCWPAARRFKPRDSWIGCSRRRNAAAGGEA